MKCRKRRTWFVGKWAGGRRRRFKTYRQAVAYLGRLKNQAPVVAGAYYIDHNGPAE